MHKWWERQSWIVRGALILIGFVVLCAAGFLAASIDGSFFSLPYVQEVYP
jgi:hypothetical protein